MYMTTLGELGQFGGAWCASMCAVIVVCWVYWAVLAYSCASSVIGGMFSGTVHIQPGNICWNFWPGLCSSHVHAAAENVRWVQCILKGCCGTLHVGLQDAIGSARV